MNLMHYPVNHADHSKNRKMFFNRLKFSFFYFHAFHPSIFSFVGVYNRLRSFSLAPELSKSFSGSGASSKPYPLMLQTVHKLFFKFNLANSKFNKSSIAYKVNLLFSFNKILALNFIIYLVK
ncbi:unnamed protein product [Meloidogyne enterolobii]|uniref:Uncharacterized protein n=1 Tax=Meloidogyne enterolobii TaxID=390850 RepID=A0ACB0YVB4_MELEN